MPGVMQYAAAKCNQLDVHHGNMNGTLKFSPEGKGRNRMRQRTFSFMQFKNICSQKNNRHFARIHMNTLEWLLDG